MTRETITVEESVEREVGVEVCDYCGLDESEELGEPVEFKSFGNDASPLHLHEPCRQEFVLAEYEPPSVSEIADETLFVLILNDLVSITIALGALGVGVLGAVYSLPVSVAAAIAILFYFVVLVGYGRGRAALDEIRELRWAP